MKVLAICVVLGALLHLLVQLPALRLVGMRWQPVWDWRDKAVREVGRLMGPRVIGLAAFQLNFVVATFFASTVGIGAISAVNYAWLIVMTPLGAVRHGDLDGGLPAHGGAGRARRGRAAGHASRRRCGSSSI